MKTQEIIEVPLNEIRELEEPFWYNHPSDIPHCRSIAKHAKLIQEASLEHPIIICPEGRIMDGMHRVCKAFILGRKTIKARRFAKMPKPDFKNVPEDQLPYD
ncbi:MAG: hypothetical protein ACWGNV_07370 [Bacteroidales bacterium]